MTRFADTYACADRPGDASAYVLGALDTEEATRFQAHLERCVVCRDEVHELSRVVDVLPAAVPQIPPPRRLRRAAVRDFRREHRAPGRRLRPTRRRPAAWAGAGLAALAAGALAIAFIVAGGNGTRTVTAFVQGPGSAEVRLGPGGNVLVVRHLPAAGAGRTYEVWLQRGQAAPQPAGVLFGVGAAGDRVVAMPHDMSGVRAVLVTRERAGGSLVPTTAPVIVAPLPE
jgi:anti-sigma-K factor RskA